MAEKLRVALIGTGSMAQRHVNAFKSNPLVDLVAVCDANLERAKNVAQSNGIGIYCSDYMELLKNEDIDAVSVVTPTFTHKQIVLDALNHGKHVLCEKPPALNEEQVRECEAAAAKAGKVLMYAFVMRFSQNINFLKDYIASGALGDIVSVDVQRLLRCSKLGGWFVDKEKSGGGQLMDAAIHQVDAALYLMGHPAIKTVRGFTSYANSDLPEKMKGLGGTWVSADNQTVKRTVESMASAYVTFENDCYMYVKASLILNTVEEGTFIDICGTKGGIRLTGGSAGSIKLVKVDESGYFLESTPVLTAKVDAFSSEMNHFVDCCVKGVECISPAKDGAEVLKLITAIYQSAEKGEEIRFS